VRLVSINAWGGAMYGRFAAWLPQVDPDVLCVQEVTHTHGHNGWTSFDDGDHALPQRADLLADIRGLLPHHQAFFAASDAGPVRDATGVIHRQEFGVGSFVHDSISVTEVASRFVHDQFTRHERWPATGRPRSALATRLAPPGGSRAITVVQVHGLRDAEGKHDTPARRAQAERLAALVTDVRRPGDIAVLCGDLNLLPDSGTFEILREAGLVDLVGTADTRSSRYVKPIRHASYLLVSEPAAVARFEVLTEPEVSDHRALLLEL
jgi:endonuclease/exonuclease/phosphatase family metal-dependent hydrolase